MIMTETEHATSSRRGLLMGLAAAAVVPAPALTTRQDADPIFAVIAEHRAAQEDVHVSCNLTDLDVDDDPNAQRAMDRASDAELPLFTTAPTTIAGVVALLEYVGSDAHEASGEKDDNGRWSTVLSYAQRWNDDERAEAAFRLPLRIAAALRLIAAA
jgi:hypothetical protein